MSKLSFTLISAIASALVIVGSASAQTETAPLTREAAIAELVAARASGELAALQAEKGVEPAASVAARTTVAAVKLPTVLTVKPAALAQTTTATLAADHGENAARELGDFPAPVLRRTPVLAGR